VIAVGVPVYAPAGFGGFSQPVWGVFADAHPSVAQAAAERRLAGSELARQESQSRLAAAERRLAESELARQESQSRLDAAERRLAGSELARQESQSRLDAAERRLAESELAGRESRRLLEEMASDAESRIADSRRAADRFRSAASRVSTTGDDLRDWHRLAGLPPALPVPALADPALLVTSLVMETISATHITCSRVDMSHPRAGSRPRRAHDAVPSYPELVKQLLRLERLADGRARSAVGEARGLLKNYMVRLAREPLVAGFDQERSLGVVFGTAAQGIERLLDSGVCREQLRRYLPVLRWCVWERDAREMGPCVFCFPVDRLHTACPQP
jgi:hypothetical protein